MRRRKERIEGGSDASIRSCEKPSERFYFPIGWYNRILPSDASSFLFYCFLLSVCLSSCMLVRVYMCEKERGAVGEGEGLPFLFGFLFQEKRSLQYDRDVVCCFRKTKEVFCYLWAKIIDRIFFYRTREILYCKNRKIKSKWTIRIIKLEAGIKKHCSRKY